MGLMGLLGTKHIFRESVQPVEGSIICCNLAGSFEHSGIYTEDDVIIHRDGDGLIEPVHPGEFLGRLNGWNPSVTIFVACRGGKPVGSREIAKRAWDIMIDPDEDGYDLFSKNCHQFCQQCITGYRNDAELSFTFSALELTLATVLGADSWHPWDFPTFWLES